ncbi:hypothetical protein HOLleu_35929 [Holothuria leucospilota]|uniref:Uncharacterized protein n=1 Tax=Holothuria leucospilota TaxID=206669 RepID=A0A9Q0YMT7_HOLLE|nr:hypothetical protein HOLleu_35929 [Holothuria leucospilota]
MNPLSRAYGAFQGLPIHSPFISFEGFVTLNRLHGHVVRASDLQPEGLGFNSWPGHTKDFKNGNFCHCAWCLA